MTVTVPFEAGAVKTVVAYPLAPVVTEVFERVPRLVEKVMVAPLKGLPFTSSARDHQRLTFALGAMVCLSPYASKHHRAAIGGFGSQILQAVNC